jgi:carbonic anhydrase
MDAQAALAQLQEGNKRYVSGKLLHPNMDIDRRESLVDGQKPFAVVLSCADSRVVPELIFDQGIGDLFVIRVAGNIAKDDELGSMEYAIAHLGCKLIVVLGHESCGAVQASMGEGDPGGHIGSLTEKIKPAVKAAKEMAGDHLVNSVKVNAQFTAKEIQESQPILADAVNNDGVLVVPAYYKLGLGQVEFL